MTDKRREILTNLVESVQGGALTSYSLEQVNWALTELDALLPTEEIKINRVRTITSAWTFTIPPIKELVMRYVKDGKNWADPFSGYNSPAEFTNDLHPDRPTKYHLEAEAFCKILPDNLNGILLDPPYSHRQISEHYKEIGKKASQLDTSYNFYHRVKEAIHKKIIRGGYAITLGWNTTGFGNKRGFEIEEILICNHGMNRNDTLVVVEKKIA